MATADLGYCIFIDCANERFISVFVRAFR